MGFFSKLFDPTAGEIKRLNKLVDQIDSFEEAHKKLTDAQLREKTAEFKARYAKGDTVTLDSARVAEGIVWGHYVGGSSGKDRWVCISQENVK